MQTDTIVARLLRCCAPLMHAARWQALCDVTTSAVFGKPLTLTGLALGTRRVISLRHRIKCVDRLLANDHLAHERFDAYRALAHQWLSDLPQMLIVVDWSSLSADLQWHWLRASVVVDGRSITLYEEVHARQQLAAFQVHQRFVKRLAALLPPSQRPPIILTDAGFRTTWFRLIAAEGWYWVGRTRNRDFVRHIGGEWHCHLYGGFAAKDLYARATGEASDLGDYEAVRNRPLTCRFALIKMKPAGRQRKYPSGKVTNNSSARKIAQRSCPLLGNREPWLLSYSPELSYLGANAIIKLYGQRIPKRGQVKIEQQFRDTKNLGLGMGLSQSKSAGQPRLQALLLIAHIAALTKRLIGEAAKAQQMALQLISNHNLKRDDISDDARYTCDRARRLARQNH